MNDLISQNFPDENSSIYAAVWKNENFTAATQFFSSNQRHLTLTLNAFASNQSKVKFLSKTLVCRKFCEKTLRTAKYLRNPNTVHTSGKTQKKFVKPAFKESLE